MKGLVVVVFVCVVVVMETNRFHTSFRFSCKNKKRQRTNDAKAKKNPVVYILCAYWERERGMDGILSFFTRIPFCRGSSVFFLKWIMIGRSSNVRPLPQAEIFQIILPIPKISIVLPTLERSKECRSRSSLQIRVWDEK